MTREEYCSSINDVLKMYPFSGTLVSCNRYGSGHINDTFLAEYSTGHGQIKYIVQRINHEIFKKPEELIDNIYRVTSFLGEKIKKAGGDPMRETLHLIKTNDGNTFYHDKNGAYWRAYDFITGTVSYDIVERPSDFYNAAFAFGTFQHMLSDFPAATLHETIPDFHNTPKRYETFLDAVQKDICHRAASVKEEIEFLKSKKETMSICANALKDGRLPLRVTHNDTKLNNVLIDKETGKGLCVIDLDTVMPGPAGFDFGDSIRFGASTAAEDEPDVSKVSLDLNLFEICTEGFLAGCHGALTKTEISMLPDCAETMILECGMRFLTDYLSGDTYFMIHRENHNLDRAHTQFALAKDLEAKRDQIDKIIEKIVEKSK